MQIGGRGTNEQDETNTRLVGSKAYTYRASPDDASHVPGDDHDEPHGFHDALQKREAAEDHDASKQHVRELESYWRRRGSLSRHIHHVRHVRYACHVCHVRGIAVDGDTSIVYAKRVGSTGREVLLPLLDDVGHLLSIDGKIEAAKAQAELNEALG